MQNRNCDTNANQHSKCFSIISLDLKLYQEILQLFESVLTRWCRWRGICTSAKDVPKWARRLMTVSTVCESMEFTPARILNLQTKSLQNDSDHWSTAIKNKSETWQPYLVLTLVGINPWVCIWWKVRTYKNSSSLQLTNNSMGELRCTLCSFLIFAKMFRDVSNHSSKKMLSKMRGSLT